MTDIFQEFINHDLSRSSNSNSRSSNHHSLHGVNDGDDDVTFTPKRAGAVGFSRQHRAALKRPSPQRQRPPQQQQPSEQSQLQLQSQLQSPSLSSPPSRSYLPSPNQKFNPQYHFVAVRSHSVDSRSTASYTTGMGASTGTGTTSLTTGMGMVADVTNAASKTSCLFGSVGGSMDEEEDNDDDHDPGEIPPITSAASHDSSGCLSATTSKSTGTHHSSSRCSSRRSFQEYMMGKMQKSLELERQLIFEQQNSHQNPHPFQNNSSQHPPLQHQSLLISNSSRTTSQNSMLPSNAIFPASGHSCSSSPREPSQHQPSTNMSQQQQQQQQHQASPSARSGAAPSTSHSAASGYWTQQQQQQQSLLTSPARSTRSASSSRCSVATAATSSTSTRLLATTTALVATAEEQLLRGHVVPGSCVPGSCTAALACAGAEVLQASSEPLYFEDNAAWNQDIGPKTTADDDEQQRSVRKSVVSSANTTFASTQHSSSLSISARVANNTTVTSDFAADVRALRRTSSDESVHLNDNQVDSTLALRHDCPDMQQRMLEESWDDAVQSTRLQQTHAASRRLNQHNYPLASASASGVTSAAAAAASGGGNGTRHRNAALHQIQAGHSQRQQLILQQSLSPQRRPPGGGTATPSFSRPQVVKTRQLEQHAAVIGTSTIERRLPSENEQQQRCQLPVQSNVAIMREQLQQQLAAKPRQPNQIPGRGASTTSPANRLHPLSSSVRNSVSSPPREQQQLTMGIQRREQQQTSPLPVDPVVSPLSQQGGQPLQPSTWAAAAAASPISPPPPLPPRQLQQQQQAQQQLSPTSRALAARHVATNIKRVRQLQLQQRQGRLNRPGLPHVPNNSNKNNDLSRQRQQQQPPPPPLPSLMSSVMSSVTLTTASEPSANLDTSSMVSICSSSSSRIFPDEKKHEEHDNSYDEHTLHQNMQYDESDNQNDSSKADSFWDHGRPQQLKSPLDDSNNTSASHNAVSPPKSGRRGGQNTNDKNQNGTQQTTSTRATAVSAKASIIAPPIETGGGGRLGARITANKMNAPTKNAGNDDDESHFSWGSLAPSHQVTTASAADTSNGGVVLSPAVGSHGLASQMPGKADGKSLYQQVNVSEVAPFDSEMTVIPQVDEDDSLVAEPRTVFSDPAGGETNYDKQSRRKATWRRQGQEQDHESLLYSPPPLMQTSSLISASEMSRRRTVSQDVLVTVGGVLDVGDLCNPLQEYQESFYHSSHILSYASPILSQHLRPTVGKKNYRLDLPRATSSEWKLLQQFLEPHSKSAAGVSMENLPTLLPWFNELQLDILLKQCDELLCTLDITVDRGIIEDDTDKKLPEPSAKDWGDLLTLAEICTLCSLPKCHEKTLEAVQLCLVRHPGLCLDLQVLNKLTRLLQGDIATRSIVWERLSPYLPDELILETRTPSQVQQMVCNTLFPYLLRQGLREAVTLLDEERNRQMETERLLKWRQRKKELESMPDDHDVENSAQTSNDISNGNSISQSSSMGELEYGRPATPPSQDEILLSRSFNEDYIHRSKTPNATNNSSYLSYINNSGTGRNKLDFTTNEYSFNSNDTNESNSSESSRLMLKLERAKFGIKQQHFDSISGDIQRKINSDPFRGYVELHYNLADWWEAWKEEPHEQGRDEQRQDDGRNDQRRAQFKQQTDKSSGGGSDTTGRASSSSEDSSTKHTRKPGKSSPTITSSMLPITKGPENRTEWLDLILQRLKRPPIFPSTPVIAEQRSTQQQPPNQHQLQSITHRQPSVVTPTGCDRRTFAC